MLPISRRFQRCLSVFLLSSLLVFAAGCGKTGTVSGKVTYKGQPLTAGMVQFFPQNKGGDFSSAIKEDGSYSISKLPPGPVKISVTSNTTSPLDNMPPMGGRGVAAKGMKEAEKMMKKSKGEGEGGGGGNPFESKKGVAIPANFGNPETSNLKLDVTGGSQPHDIKLD